MPRAFVLPFMPVDDGLRSLLTPATMLLFSIYLLRCLFTQHGFILQPYIIIIFIFILNGLRLYYYFSVVIWNDSLPTIFAMPFHAVLDILYSHRCPPSRPGRFVGNAMPVCLSITLFLLFIIRWAPRARLRAMPDETHREVAAARRYSFTLTRQPRRYERINIV